MKRSIQSVIDEMVSPPALTAFAQEMRARNEAFRQAIDRFTTLWQVRIENNFSQGDKAR